MVFLSNKLFIHVNKFYSIKIKIKNLLLNSFVIISQLIPIVYYPMLSPKVLPTKVCSVLFLSFHVSANLFL